MSRLARFLTALPIFFIPIAAYAHPGHNQSVTLMDGILHPVTGLDHLLAMVGVGIWAARQSIITRLLAPISFMALMFVGAVIGGNGATFPYNEFAIAVSVLLIGAAIAFKFYLPPLTGALMIGAFAVLHGVAHGSEASGALTSSFIFGMLLATAFLHALGFFIAWTAIKNVRRLSRDHTAQDKSDRWIGATIVMGGLALLLSA